LTPFSACFNSECRIAGEAALFLRNTFPALARNSSSPLGIHRGETAWPRDGSGTFFHHLTHPPVNTGEHFESDPKRRLGGLILRSLIFKAFWFNFEVANF